MGSLLGVLAASCSSTSVLANLKWTTLANHFCKKDWPTNITETLAAKVGQTMHNESDIYIRTARYTGWFPVNHIARPTSRGLHNFRVM